jgi:hypothetical protein
MKNHHHNGPVHPSNREQNHEIIAARAYDLWLRHGKPDSRSDEIWLEAEREIMAARSPRSATIALPTSF